jgi:hypothetical protein
MVKIITIICVTFTAISRLGFFMGLLTTSLSLMIAERIEKQKWGKAAILILAISFISFTKNLSTQNIIINTLVFGGAGAFLSAIKK